MSYSCANDYARFMCSVSLSSPAADDAAAMRLILDSLPLPLLIVNQLNLITYLNREAERFLAIEAADALGRDWSDIVKIRDRRGRAVNYRLMEMHTSVRLPGSREWWLIHANNGEELPAQLSVAPIRNPDQGRHQGYVAVFYEISEIQQLLAPVCA